MSEEGVDSTLCDPKAAEVESGEWEERLRREALDMALKAMDLSGSIDFTRIIRDAQRFYEWLSLRKTTHLALVVGEITKQDSQHKENAVQLHDDEQFTVSVQAQDAKGFATTDNLTWTVDNGDVVSLQVADDTMSALVVAGNPGSAVITLTDGNLTVTEAIDVVPAGAATISLTEGEVSKQGGTEPTEPGTGEGEPTGV